MNKSTVKIVTIPQGGTNAPAMLAVSANLPSRLMVRNIGPSILILAHESNAIAGTQGASATDAYQLPPGAVDVFVLAPSQGMYAVGSGAGGRASIALSEASPTVKWES